MCCGKKTLFFHAVLKILNQFMSIRQDGQQVVGGHFIMELNMSSDLTGQRLPSHGASMAR